VRETESNSMMVKVYIHSAEEGDVMDQGRIEPGMRLTNWSGSRVPEVKRVSKGTFRGAYWVSSKEKIEQSLVGTICGTSWSYTFRAGE